MGQIFGGANSFKEAQLMGGTDPLGFLQGKLEAGHPVTSRNMPDRCALDVCILRVLGEGPDTLGALAILEALHSSELLDSKTAESAIRIAHERMAPAFLAPMSMTVQLQPA